MVPKKRKSCHLWQQKRVDLEGIMLSEIGQGKTYTVWFYFYVESVKKKKKKLERDQIFGYRDGMRNPMEKHNQKVQTSSYKYSGCYVQHEKMDAN